MTTTKHIKSMNDLKAERRRLKAEIAEKEQLLKSDFDGFQEAIKPLHVVSGFLSKFVVAKDKDLLNTGIESALSFVLKNVVLARAGWLTKLVVPYVAKKYAGNKITENKADIVHTVREWLHRLQEKRRAKTNGHYDRSTADIDF